MEKIREQETLIEHTEQLLSDAMASGDPESIVKAAEKRLVKDICEENAIDNQSNVIAHQHCGHKIAGMPVEEINGLL